MGKYTGQASSYKQEIGMVETALNNALSQLNSISIISDSGDNMDALGSNTSGSITLIKESINNLLSIISTNKSSLMNKGIEIDKRLEAEERRRLEEQKKNENKDKNVSQTESDNGSSSSNTNKDNKSVKDVTKN